MYSDTKTNDKQPANDPGIELSTFLIFFFNMKSPEVEFR